MSLGVKASEFLRFKHLKLRPVLKPNLVFKKTAQNKTTRPANFSSGVYKRSQCFRLKTKQPLLASLFNKSTYKFFSRKALFKISSFKITHCYKKADKGINVTIKAKPFLKWAGGKTQLLKDIEDKFPYKKNDTFNYVEPFVGSGAVLFWALNSFPNLKNVVINDINQDLVEAYKTIKNNVQGLILVLKKYESEYHLFSEITEEKKQYYYNKRQEFNSRDSDRVTQAALLIFLNRTCFNGLYRVNKKNEFNVPIGSYKKPMICDEANLLAVSKKLQKVEIITGDFEATLSYADENTIFYLDPPYKPLSETSSFNSYAKEVFCDDEQIRLKRFCDDLNTLNAKWILSNSDVKGINPNDDFFDDLFCDYQINRVLAKRSINSDSKNRGKLQELLISNLGVKNAF